MVRRIALLFPRNKKKSGQKGQLRAGIARVWNRYWQLIIFALLASLSLAAYATNLRDSLICDDYYWLAIDRRHLFGNADLGSLSLLKWPFYAQYPVYLRPLLLVIWMFIAGIVGTTSWPYHLINIFLHAGIAWLLFWFLSVMKASKPAAIIAAVLFVLTPIAPEAVTWSAGNSDLVAFFFILLSLGMYGGYLRKLRRRLYFFALLLTAAALASKETALILIPGIVAMDFLFARVPAHPDGREHHGLGLKIKQTVKRLAPFFGIFSIYMLLRLLILGSFYFAPPSSKDNWSKASGLLSSAKVMLSPLDRNEFSSGFVKMIGIFMLIVLLISMVRVIWGWRKASGNQRKLWVFLTIMFLASLAPAFSFLAEGITNDMTRTHVLYVPTAFFLALIVVGFTEFSWKKNDGLLFVSGLVLVLTPIYFYAVRVNNIYWQNVAAIESNILNEISKQLPNPPENAKIYLRSTKRTRMSRIYWCNPMLETAVRVNLDRLDLQVVESEPDGLDPVDLSSTEDGYLIYFDEATGRITQIHSSQN